MIKLKQNSVVSKTITKSHREHFNHAASEDIREISFIFHKYLNFDLLEGQVEKQISSQKSKYSMSENSVFASGFSQFHAAESNCHEKFRELTNVIKHEKRG
mmetsp:Transcript_13597/g.38267  ORF Transcript_13597/g.38267 Transcript_13597/m.38267 type:complete len:101 (-) Transcript_13597:1657-1959(-)